MQRYIIERADLPGQGFSDQYAESGQAALSQYFNNQPYREEGVRYRINPDGHAVGTRYSKDLTTVMATFIAYPKEIGQP